MIIIKRVYFYLILALVLLSLVIVLIQSQTAFVVNLVEEIYPADTLTCNIKYLVSTDQEDNSSRGLKIMAVGDIMMHMPLVTAAQNQKEYDFTPFFKYVKPIFAEADLVFGNLETSFAGPEVGFRGYDRFNTPDQLADALKDAGFTVLTTANNHTFDHGMAGMTRTLQQLDQRGLVHTGAFRSKEEREQITLVERNGILTAVLAYTYGSNISIPEGRDYLLNIADFDRMKDDLEKARAMGADLVTVSIHFGEEYKVLPNKDQFLITDFLFANGADIIFGSHPHVLQPYEIREWLSDVGSSRRGVVIYSLGNFISNQRTHPRDLGGILSIQIEKTGDEVNIVDVDFIPTYVHKYNINTKTYFHVLPIEETLANRDVPGLAEKDYQQLEKRFLELNQLVSSSITHLHPTMWFGELYKVKPGDTFTKIARELGVTLHELKEVNNDINPNNLKIGQIIRLPERLKKENGLN